MNEMRCYVCGNPIGKVFSLVSMSEEDVDRVFIVHSACVARVEDVGIAVEVKRQ